MIPGVVYKQFLPGLVFDGLIRLSKPQVLAQILEELGFAVSLRVGLLIFF